MSNKPNEKMDGAIESTTEKNAATASKPARPPKPKKPLSRDTKVGLAVIVALLVIFAVVLVVRFRGNADDDLAENDTASEKTDAKSSQKSTTTPPASKDPFRLTPQNGAAQYLNTDSFPKASAPRNDVGSPGSAYQNQFGSAANVNGSTQPAYGTTSADGATALRNSLDGSQTGNSDIAGYNPLRDTELEMRGAGELGAGSKPPFPSGLSKDDGLQHHLMNGANAADSTQQQGPGNSLDINGQNASAAAIDQRNPFPNTGRGGAEQTRDVRDRANPARSKNREAVSKGVEADPITTSDPANSRTADDALGAGAVQPDFANSFSMQDPAGDSKAVARSSAANGDGDRPGDVPSTTLTPVEGLAQGAPPPSGSATTDSLFRNPSASTGANFIESTGSSAEPARLANERTTAPGAKPPAPIHAPDPALADQSYTVQSRESYWTIAQKQYGSGAYFRALYEHNRRNGAPEVLQVGAQLRLPDEATLQRLYPDLCPRPRRLAAAPRATRASANVPNGREYVVSEGDTLYEIARRELGKGARWADIYELNRDTIGPVTARLEPNTKLVLPNER